MGCHGYLCRLKPYSARWLDAAIYAGRGGKIELWNRADTAALFGYEA